MQYGIIAALIAAALVAALSPLSFPADKLANGLGAQSYAVKLIRH